jgi:CheY-like chemotaxis protein
MRKRKILVVDDEPGVTRLMKLVLPIYEVCEENNPSNALDTALKFQPDLILLDVIMPDMHGGTVAARIREEPSLSGVPIVFLTAIVSQSQVTADATINGFPFLAKPVRRDAVIECIKRHLGE